MNVSSLSVAKLLIKESRYRISNLVLQKLLFFIYGVNLCLNDRVRIDEKPQAWQYGPVFPKVYRKYRKYGADAIRHTVRSSNITDSNLREIVKLVYQNYGCLKPWQLVLLTHKKDSPWERVWSHEGIYYDIPDKLIKEYFDGRVVRKKLA